MAKSKSASPTAPLADTEVTTGQGPAFEVAMTELQQIVSDLEDNSLGLEASLAQFEKGIGLLRTCYQFLDQAEQKIEVLVNFKATGEATTAPFDATPTANSTDSKTLF